MHTTCTNFEPVDCLVENKGFSDGKLTKAAVVSLSALASSLYNLTADGAVKLLRNFKDWCKIKFLSFSTYCCTMIAIECVTAKRLQSFNGLSRDQPM